MRFDNIMCNKVFISVGFEHERYTDDDFDFKVLRKWVDKVNQYQYDKHIFLFSNSYEEDSKKYLLEIGILESIVSKSIYICNNTHYHAKYYNHLDNIIKQLKDNIPNKSDVVLMGEVFEIKWFLQDLNIKFRIDDNLIIE